MALALGIWVALGLAVIPLAFAFDAWPHVFITIVVVLAFGATVAYWVFP